MIIFNKLFIFYIQLKFPTIPQFYSKTIEYINPLLIQKHSLTFMPYLSAIIMRYLIFSLIHQCHCLLQGSFGGYLLMGTFGGGRDGGA